MGINDSLRAEYPEGIYSNFCKKQESAEANNDEQETEVETNPGLKDKPKMNDAVSAEDLAMLDLVNAKDAKEKEVFDKFVVEAAKTSAFSKLIPFNKPSGLIFTASFGAVLNGSAMPIFGLIFSFVLTVLTSPKDDKAYIEEKVKFYSGIMGIVALVSSLSSFVQKYSFGTLGNNVTGKIRNILYGKILEKNIGFFDDREHASSVLTSSMAQDTSIVNGVSSESLGPMFEGGCAFVVGLGIGFYFQWKESLVCLCVAPIMAIGNALEMKFMQGLTEDSNELLKEANLLCGDAIINYKTVQSFGFEEEIVKVYDEFL